MKILDYKPTNSYTCQGCYKSFNSNQDLLCDHPFNPTCGPRCSFLVIYRILKKLEFSDKLLEFYAKRSKFWRKNMEFSRNKGYYYMARDFSNQGLSSIKPLLRLWLKAQAQRKELKSGKNSSRLNKPHTYIIGVVEPVLDPVLENNSKKGLSRFSKGGDLKWS